jgi:hypothetical protein
MTKKKTKIEIAAENLKSITALDTSDMTKNADPNRILAGAYDMLEDVVIMGNDKEGNHWFSSSIADGGDILWLLEHLKIQLLSPEDED